MAAMDLCTSGSELAPQSASFPLCASSAEPQSAGRPGARARRGMRVLIVDDNRDAAESLAILLSLKGHETQCANDGQAALAVAAQYLPDAVILDLGLPMIDGYEAARQMRRLPGLESVRLIAVTGYGQSEDRARAMEAGFDAFLVKPVDTEVLERNLRA